MATVLGTKIKAERKKLKLTLDQLAEKTESSKSYIWELENGDNVRPSADKIAKIAGQLSVTIEYLLDDQKLSAENSDFDKAFFRRFEQLDQAKKDKLRAILDVLDGDN